MILSGVKNCNGKQRRNQTNKLKKQTKTGMNVTRNQLWKHSHDFRFAVSKKECKGRNVLKKCHGNNLFIILHFAVDISLYL